VIPLAKTPTTTSAPTKTPASFLPKSTDPRAELFFLLGALKGGGIESASRITELVIDLTAVTPPTAEGE
jgi:hypothetical protein